METPRFAHVKAVKSDDPLVEAAANNFLEACQGTDRPNVAAALHLAANAPGGLLTESYIRTQKSRITPEVKEALGLVADLLWFNADAAIEFEPTIGAVAMRHTIPTLRRRRIEATTPVAKGETALWIRLAPLTRYIATLALEAGDYVPGFGQEPRR